MTEHKRLTTKEKYPHGAEGVSKDKLTGKYCRGVFEATACVEKLAEYETAEEEGRLVVLPCKVGDAVYVIDEAEFLSIRKTTIEGITIDKSGISFMIPTKKTNMLFGYYIPDFGKTVFLTREEAEKALTEMEEKCK